MADKNKTVERVVKARFVRYTKLVAVPGQDNPRAVMASARYGETVNVLEAEAERGDSLGLFMSSAEVTHTPDGDIIEVDVREMSDADLAAWIKNDKPKAAEVVELADNDAQLAERLLNAERTATNGRPRKTVNEPLTAIIDAAATEGTGVETVGTP